MRKLGPQLGLRPGRRRNFPAPLDDPPEAQPLRLCDEDENWLLASHVVIETIGRMTGKVEYRKARAQGLDPTPGSEPSETQARAAQRDDRHTRAPRVILGQRNDPNLAPGSPRAKPRQNSRRPVAKDR